MFTARLGSRLARLGNIVLGFIENPSAFIYGQRNGGLNNIQNSARIASQSSERADNLQVSHRISGATSRRSNIQTNRRK